mgnify:CR=1 FL=1
MTKQCNKCKEIKELVLFKKEFAKWTTKDGVNHKKRKYIICKKCDNKYNRDYRKKNKARLDKQRRELYWKDHDKTLKKKAEWRDSHREYVQNYAKKWNEENKERKAKKDKEWVKNNLEKRRKVSNKYANKPEIKLKQSMKFKKASKNLEDGYVKDSFIKRTSLSRADVSDEMVKLQRKHLKLKRAIKDE